MFRVRQEGEEETEDVSMEDVFQISVRADDVQAHYVVPAEFAKQRKKLESLSCIICRQNLTYRLKHDKVHPSWLTAGEILEKLNNPEMDDMVITLPTCKPKHLYHFKCFAWANLKSPIPLQSGIIDDLGRAAVSEIVYIQFDEAPSVDGSGIEKVEDFVANRASFVRFKCFMCTQQFIGGISDTYKKLMQVYVNSDSIDPAEIFEVLESDQETFEENFNNTVRRCFPSSYEMKKFILEQRDLIKALRHEIAVRDAHENPRSSLPITYGIRLKHELGRLRAQIIGEEKIRIGLMQSDWKDVRLNDKDDIIHDKDDVIESLKQVVDVKSTIIVDRDVKIKDLKKEIRICNQEVSKRDAEIMDLMLKNEELEKKVEKGEAVEVEYFKLLDYNRSLIEKKKFLQVSANIHLENQVQLQAKYESACKVAVELDRLNQKYLNGEQVPDVSRQIVSVQLNRIIHSSVNERSDREELNEDRQPCCSKSLLQSRVSEQINIINEIDEKSPNIEVIQIDDE